MGIQDDISIDKLFELIDQAQNKAIEGEDKTAELALLSIIAFTCVNILKKLIEDGD